MTHLHAAEHVGSDHAVTRNDTRENDEATFACGGAAGAERERGERREREREREERGEERREREREHARDIVLLRQNPVKTDPAARKQIACHTRAHNIHETK